MCFCLYLVAEHQKQVCCVLAPGAAAALFIWNNRILARSAGVLQPLDSASTRLLPAYMSL